MIVVIMGWLRACTPIPWRANCQSVGRVVWGRYQGEGRLQALLSLNRDLLGTQSRWTSTLVSPALVTPLMVMTL